MARGQTGFFVFKQKTAYEISLGLVGSEMCIRVGSATIPVAIRANFVLLISSSSLMATRALPFEMTTITSATSLARAHKQAQTIGVISFKFPTRIL